MPFETQWFSPGFWSRFKGTLTDVELRRCVEGVCVHRFFDEHRYHVVDLSDVDFVDVSDEAILEASAQLLGSSATNASVLVVAVSASALVDALLDRFVTLGVVPFPIKRVRAHEDALAWIDRMLPVARQRSTASRSPLGGAVRYRT